MWYAPPGPGVQTQSSLCFQNSPAPNSCPIPAALLCKSISSLCAKEHYFFCLWSSFQLFLGCGCSRVFHNLLCSFKMRTMRTQRKSFARSPTGLMWAITTVYCSCLTRIAAGLYVSQKYEIDQNSLYFKIRKQLCKTTNHSSNSGHRQHV